jgi:hypothetical protein
MYPVVHGKVLDGSSVRIGGNQQNTQTFLDFQIGVTAVLRELCKGSLRRNSMILANQLRAELLVHFFINRTVREEGSI